MDIPDAFNITPPEQFIPLDSSSSEEEKEIEVHIPAPLAQEYEKESTFIISEEEQVLRAMNMHLFKRLGNVTETQGVLRDICSTLQTNAVRIDILSQKKK